MKGPTVAYTNCPLHTNHEWIPFLKSILVLYAMTASYVQIPFPVVESSEAMLVICMVTTMDEPWPPTIMYS